MGPTRCHRWWSFREALLQWNLDPEPRALRRFYSPDAAEEHSTKSMYATDTVHVALDIVEEGLVDIEQWRNNTWFNP